MQSLRQKFWRNWTHPPLAILALIPFANLTPHPEGQVLGKWWLIYSWIGLCALELATRKAWLLPKISSRRLVQICLAMLVGVVAILDWNGVFDFHRLAFITVALWALNQEQDALDVVRPYFAAAALTVIGLIAKEFVDLGFRWSRDLLPEVLAGGFGNANMAGEFLAFVYPLMLFNRARSTKMRVVYGLMSVLCLIALAATRCRSAQIAAALVTLVFIVRLRSVAAVIAAVVLTLGVGAALYGVSSARNKLNTLFQRGQIWTQTVLMIKDHPLGVGRHEFGFNFLPYQGGEGFGEDKIMSNPHNEFLLTAAEDGLPYTLLVFTLLIGFFLKTWRHFGRLEYALLAVLGTQMMLQFPLENPLPFLITAIALGEWLKFRRPLTRLLNNNGLIGLQCALMLGLVFLGYRTIYPQWAVAQDQPQVSELRYACNLNPRDSRACWALGATAARSGQFEACVRDMSDSLARYPDFAIYRKVRGFCYLQMNEVAQGCADLTAYLSAVRSPPITRLREQRCGPDQPK